MVFVNAPCFAAIAAGAVYAPSRKGVCLLHFNGGFAGCAAVCAYCLGGGFFVPIAVGNCACRRSAFTLAKQTACFRISAHTCYLACGVGIADASTLLITHQPANTVSRSVINACYRSCGIHITDTALCLHSDQTTSMPARYCTCSIRLTDRAIYLRSDQAANAPFT